MNSKQTAVALVATNAVVTLPCDDGTDYCLDVTVLENARSGGVLAAAPSSLEMICRYLGFRNACKSGRVYLTGSKMARLGLADAVGTDTGWRSR